MEQIIILLYESNGLFDDLISWRLESNWVHATIEIDGYVYSSTFPKTVKVIPTDKEVAMPPRTGTSFKIDVTTEQKDSIKTYLESRVGTKYDVLSMLGWFLRIRELQSKNLTYCFEMVYDSLVAGGLETTRGKKYITGDQLENYILRLGGTTISSNAKNLKRSNLLPSFLRIKKE